MLNDTGTASHPSLACNPLRESGTEAARIVLGSLEQLLDGYDAFKILQAEKVLYIYVGVVDKR